MPIQLPVRGVAAAMLPLLITVVLPASPGHAQCLATERRIEVDRQLVRTEGVNNLSELLSRVSGARRLGTFVVRAVDLPLVIVDGVILHDGLRFLDAIPIAEVERVTTLRPLDAVTRFGGTGQGGAILVQTVQGRVARGAVRGEPPLLDCARKRDP